MFAVSNPRTDDVLYVYKHLHPDCKIELDKLKISKQQVIRRLTGNNAFVVKLKKTGKPVALYSITELDENCAGITLLMSDELNQGNLITFLKGAKKQVNEWCKQYKLVLDYCYLQNETVKKWLRLLGFKQSIYGDYNFRIYYRGDINEYN